MASGCPNGGVACPTCGRTSSRVRWSRRKADAIRRYRSCSAGHRFQTEERIAAPYMQKEEAD